MRKFVVRDFGRWFHQNGARYTGAFFEGVLLDNFILECRRGYAACYEHPLNASSSVYQVEFAPFANWDACMELFDRFYEKYDENAATA